MARRLNTIIIVPHSKAKFLKFSFSTRAFVVASAAVAVGVVLAVAAISYTGSAVSRRAELARLEAENLELREVNDQLEGTISEVQSRLDEFEERTERLALAAGLEGDVGLFATRDSATDHAGSGGPYDRLADSPTELAAQGDTIAAGLASIEELLSERGDLLACTPTVAPVQGIFTDGFGRRRDPFTGRWAQHKGLDISARQGTEVHAPADGVVVFCGRDKGYGKVVRVSHGFGYTTTYGHLHRIDVEPGQKVERGDVLGRVGSTGRSTGPHLHYEVRVDGSAVNPLYYILDTL